jgi:hypothetical protein
MILRRITEHVRVAAGSGDGAVQPPSAADRVPQPLETGLQPRVNGHARTKQWYMNHGSS